MNRNKMILAIIGGVIGVAVLATGYLVWSAYSAKTVALEGDDMEGIDGLEQVTAKVEGLAKKPVYPCVQSVQAIESNRAQIVAWKDEARKLAAGGDRTFAATTPAAFKSFIVDDAKRIGALKGATGAPIVKPEFGFGPFASFITEGNMPEEARLPELQREWDDVALVMELLATNGAVEVVDFQFATRPAPEVKEEAVKGKKKPAKGKDAQADFAATVSAYTYTFKFTTRPSGFVKTLNGFATSERFIVVDNFSIVHERDAVSDALGGGEKKQDAQPAGGRRGGRRRATAAAEENAEGKAAVGGVITDPAQDDPFKVEMTLSVYDFRSQEQAPQEAEGKEESK